jgi:F-type H+-transporting ATPase subunit epsilon
MAEQLRVRLVTPERILVDQEAAAVELPGKSGYLEVLYGHAPLLTELGAGEVRMHAAGPDGQGERYNVSWGFAEVLPDRVTILASDALRPNEIDTARAEEQKRRGEQMWNQAGDSEEKYAEANRVLHEAQAKLDSAGSGH